MRKLETGLRYLSNLQDPLEIKLLNPDRKSFLNGVNGSITFYKEESITLEVSGGCKPSAGFILSLVRSYSSKIGIQRFITTC